MNPFKSLSDLKVQHRIILPPPHSWYLLPEAQCVHGQINGIHTITGQAVASNGIHVCLLTSNGSLDFGHRDWFEPHTEQPLAAKSSHTKATRAAAPEPSDNAWEEYV